MSQTFEAIIDEKGFVRLLKPVQLTGARRALVTILDEGSIVNDSDFDSGYREMGLDEDREREAVEFSESTIGDVSDETR
jgi:hypothetical protein